MAQPAWDNILVRWGQAKGSITIGNSNELIGIVIYNNRDYVGSFIDSRDGKTYSYVTIGKQVWMTDNLAYKPINGNYWVYNNRQDKIAKFGYLYDWETARKGCPKGWHLPSDNEWKTLEMYLGMSQSAVNKREWRGNDEGRKLKSKTGWNCKSNGIDKFDFSALPGGSHNYDDYFFGIDDYGYWWSSTQSNAMFAWSRYLYYLSSDIYRDFVNKGHGFSVRCLKD